MVPLFCCIKNETRLRSINNVFTKILFAPIALFLSIAFITLNLLLLPLAYLTALYHKLKLLCQASSSSNKSSAIQAK